MYNSINLKKGTMLDMEEGAKIFLTVIDNVCTMCYNIIKVISKYKNMLICSINYVLKCV